MVSLDLQKIIEIRIVDNNQDLPYKWSIISQCMINVQVGQYKMFHLYYLKLNTVTLFQNTSGMKISELSRGNEW